MWPSLSRSYRRSYFAVGAAGAHGENGRADDVRRWRIDRDGLRAVPLHGLVGRWHDRGFRQPIHWGAGEEELVQSIYSVVK